MLGGQPSTRLTGNHLVFGVWYVWILYKYLVHELSTSKGFTGGRARFGRTVAQLAEPEFYFIVSPRLCFLPVPDGLSDDDPRLAGGHLELELLQSMRAVASVMRSLSVLSTPCPERRR